MICRNSYEPKAAMCIPGSMEDQALVHPPFPNSGSTPAVSYVQFITQQVHV